MWDFKVKSIYYSFIITLKPTHAGNYLPRANPGKKKIQLKICMIPVIPVRELISTVRDMTNLKC